MKDVLKKIADKESSQPSIDPKSSADGLKKYFEEILPDYDRGRVYVSDIKKVVQWYNILQKAEMLNFDEAEEEVKTDEEGKSEEKE